MLLARHTNGARHAHSARLNGVEVWLMTVLILMVTCRWVDGMVWVGALTLCGDVRQVRGTHCIPTKFKHCVTK